MADQTPLTTGGTRPLSAQEYLEMLRQRRAQREGGVAQETQTTVQPDSQQPETQQTAPEQPSPEQQPQTSPDPNLPPEAWTYNEVPSQSFQPAQPETQQPTPEQPIQEQQQPAPESYQDSQYQSAPQSNPSLIPGFTKPIPEETLLTWTAPSRPFKKRNRQYYTTIVAIVILVSLILLFAGQFLPIAVVFSVGFLAYVLSSVEPGMVSHSITTYGIRTEGMLYFWEELGRFWYEEKFGTPLLSIEISRFPGRLSLLVGDTTKEQLSEILTEVLLEEKPKPTFFDKAGQWLQEKIPLEVQA